MIAKAPDGPVTVPRSVASLVGAHEHTAVWVNQLGGITWEVRPSRAERWFVKWAPPGVALDLAAEAARMRWAVAYTPVPRVLDHLITPDGEILVTAGLAGDSAVDDRWKAEPRTAVRALGRGLRALHDALPVDTCPFTWEAPDRIAWARAHRAPDAIEDPPPVDVRVVCHGDACAPNTLLGPDGKWTAHVDLGTLGTADRWADIAVATWSTEWNYGPGWDDELLEAYGIAPDRDRTDFYRRLWDLDP